MKYSDFLFCISIAIVFLPMTFQLLICSNLLKQNKSNSFGWLFGINIALQLIVTALSFIIQGNSFYQRALENGWTNPPFNLPPPIIGFPISFFIRNCINDYRSNPIKKNQEIKKSKNIASLLFSLSSFI